MLMIKTMINIFGNMKITNYIQLLEMIISREAAAVLTRDRRVGPVTGQAEAIHPQVSGPQLLAVESTGMIKGQGWSIYRHKTGTIPSILREMEWGSR